MITYINVRLFEEEFKEYSGNIMIHNNTFIDSKFLDVLVSLKIKVDVIFLMKMSAKLIKECNVGLGPNFYIIENGVIKLHIDKLLPSKILLEKIELI